MSASAQPARSIDASLLASHQANTLPLLHNSTHMQCTQSWASEMRSGDA